MFGSGLHRSFKVASDVSAHAGQLIPAIRCSAASGNIFGHPARGAVTVPDHLASAAMQGGDLREAIWRDIRQGTSEYDWYNKGKDVALAVARGLHFLHRNGVVHRHAQRPRWPSSAPVDDVVADTVGNRMGAAAS